MRKAADEVALAKSVVHGDEAEGGSMLQTRLVFGVKLVESNDADSMSNVIIVGYLNTLW